MVVRAELKPGSLPANGGWGMGVGVLVKPKPKSSAKARIAMAGFWETRKRMVSMSSMKRRGARGQPCFTPLCTSIDLLGSKGAEKKTLRSERRPRFALQTHGGMPMW